MMNIYIKPLFVCALTAISLTSIAAPIKAGDVHGETDQIIVRFVGNPSGAPDGENSPLRSHLQSLRNKMASKGVSAVYRRKGGGENHVLKLDRRMGGDDLNRLIKSLRSSNPSVSLLEPDVIMQATMIPNDSMYSSQWHYYESVAGINLPAAWDFSTGLGVVVSVIDTGYRPHDDLVGNIIGGYDFISNATISNDGDGRDADAQDPGDGCSSSPSSWHGTHVAGTIAAMTNNGLGVAGVAFNSKLIFARVLGCGGGYTSDIVDAIEWSSGGVVPGVPINANPARVLNLSLGAAGACGGALQSAIHSARSRNSVVVAAAGNSSTDANGFAPANCNGVLTVAALGRDGAKSSYSNFGSVVEVAAPGTSVLSTVDTGYSNPAGSGYAYYQGTSMAAPHVAGVAALVISRNPSLNPNQVSSIIQRSARAFPQECNGCGSGILNAYAAVVSPVTAEGNFFHWSNSSTARGAANNYTHYFADINGDGRADWIQVANTYNQGWVALGQADGNYSHWVMTTSAAGAVRDYAHYFADVNGDGKADWIQVSRSTNMGWIGLATGGGNFQFWSNSSTARGATNNYTHYFADVNGDGRADWIQVENVANQAWVSLGQADGNYTHWVTTNTTAGAVRNYAHYFADVNGDGKADWIQVSRSTNMGWIGIATGGGEFQFWSNSSALRGAANRYTHYFSDVNGDGRADWIQVENVANQGWVSLGQADGNYSHWTMTTTAAGAARDYAHYFADINGDGKADWVQVSRSTNMGWVGLATGGGNFQFWTNSSPERGASNYYAHYFADINGDGKSDWIQVARSINMGWVGLAY